MVGNNMIMEVGNKVEYLDLSRLSMVDHQTKVCLVKQVFTQLNITDGRPHIRLSLSDCNGNKITGFIYLNGATPPEDITWAVGRLVNIQFCVQSGGATLEINSIEEYCNPDEETEILKSNFCKKLINLAEYKLTLTKRLEYLVANPSKSLGRTVCRWLQQRDAVNVIANSRDAEVLDGTLGADLMICVNMSDTLMQTYELYSLGSQEADDLQAMVILYFYILCKTKPYTVENNPIWMIDAADMVKKVGDNLNPDELPLSSIRKFYTIMFTLFDNCNPPNAYGVILKNMLDVTKENIDLAARVSSQIGNTCVLHRGKSYIR